VAIGKDDDGGAREARESLPSQLSALIREIADGARPDGERRWEARLAPGAVIGRFEMVREVGRGGFGIVYEARDRALGRTVAFKALKAGPPSGGSRDRILHEAEVAAGLSHPNIATLFDVGQCEEGPYLVFEFLKGETLRTRLERGRVPVAEALRTGLEAARGIAHAHSNGVVHRDLTPANVFLCSDGSVKILDLGMAHGFGRRPVSGGTPGYMAPEQVRGGPEDERTDVFGLGVLLYRMLVGDTPFPRGKGPTRAAPRIDVPDVPGLGEFVGEMLALDPVDRPRDGAKVVEELARIQRDLERAPPSTDPVVLTRWRHPVRWPAVAGAAGVLLLALAGAFYLLPSRASASRRPTVASIAVLPFSDLSPQQDQRYLSDGISEEILNRLSRIEGLRVPGRTSTLRLRDQKQSMADLGRDLGVSAVLDGSVRLDGNRIRVNAQVVSVADGYPLWSASYDREFTEVFAVEDEISRAVVEALRVRLLGGGGYAARYPTTSPEAYRHYLRAREQLGRYTAESLQQAVDELRLALDIDPGYAPAWASIVAPTFVLASRAETPEGVQAGRRRAREAAEKALALAPDLPDARVARAALRLWIDRDKQGAREDLEKAVAVDGGNPDTRRRYAMVLGSMGRLLEAVEQARIAADIDPYGLSSGALGKLYQAQGDLERADAALRRHLRLEPGNLPALLMLGQNLLLQGRADAALATFQSLPDEDYRLWGTAIAAHSLGRKADSDAALAQLTGRFEHARAFEIAMVHAWRGERSEAFAWLDRALDQGETRISGLDTLEPLMRSLREDPRFGALIARADAPVR
jgi:serine/threonine protein kinase/tetratricopeptide (TPR) repeat protein